MRITIDTWRRVCGSFATEYLAREYLRGKTRPWVAQLRTSSRYRRPDTLTMVNSLVEMGDRECRLRGRKRFAGVIRRILVIAQKPREDKFASFYVDANMSYDYKCRPAAP